MKATLLALLTLGSLAMAAEEPQTLTVIPTPPSPLKVDKGSYDTIVFTLTDDGNRTKVLNGASFTSTVTLDSIKLAGQDTQKTDVLANWHPVITDGEGTIVGLSMTASTTDKENHKLDWGWDYSRSYATFIDFVGADLTSPLTLSLDQEYRLYLGDSAQAMELYQALWGVARGFTTGPVVISPDYYTPGVIKVTTAGGTYNPDSSHEYGLMNNGGIAGASWAPLMGVTVENINVPEPTTGTLSLLALAGLCIRRRK